MIDTPKTLQVTAYAEGMRAWRPEFEALRLILLGAGLDEEMKWRKPCYMHAGSNVVIFPPFKELCAAVLQGRVASGPRRCSVSEARTPVPRCAWSFAPSQMSPPRGGRSPLVQDAIRIEQAGLSVLKPAPARRWTLPPRNSAGCSTRTLRCSTHGTHPVPPSEAADARLRRSFSLTGSRQAAYDGDQAASWLHIAIQGAGR